MAMPAATPTLIDRVEPNWAMDTVRSRAGARLLGQTGPLLAEQQHGSAGGRSAVSIGSAPGWLSTATTGTAAAAGEGEQRADVGVVAQVLPYRSVTIAPRRFQRRRPTMCTSSARKALAVRTTVPMFRSCPGSRSRRRSRAGARSRSATIALTVQ